METLECGSCRVSIGTDGCAVHTKTGIELASFPLDIEVAPLGSADTPCSPFRLRREESQSAILFSAVCETSFWAQKTVVLEVGKTWISLYARVIPRENGGSRISFIRYGKPFFTAASRMFSPRFDWSRGIVHFDPCLRDELSCQQWFSPPPFFFGLEAEGAWFGAGIFASPGGWNFMSLTWNGGDSPSFSLDYEGHGDAEGGFETPRLTLDLSGHRGEFEALGAYTAALERGGLIQRPERKIPKWWNEPMFCGWGEQRLHFRAEHGGTELSSWINAGDYSTEQFYRRSLGIFDKFGVDPGIVVIDCFWAAESCRAEPNPLRWANMRAFIDEQHERGRKVLLWYSPILAEGLPAEACMTVGGRRIAGDPESPAYRELIAEEIRKMISSEQGCLNADGFKIDFTQNIPSERGTFRNYLDTRRNIISERQEDNYPTLSDRESLVRQSGSAWGCELVRAYIEAVREPLKKVKPDGLLITHTANPRLADLVDMLRLNDMDGTSPDVLGIMGARAKIAKACNPAWLIDTDNDLMVSREMWRKYLSVQSSLGNPDTYYVTGIAVSGEAFDERDYALLRNVFAAHREKREFR